MAAITAEHGTISAYTNRRCRCDECRLAMRDYYQMTRRDMVNREFFGELLHEIAPDGLTDDCPVRKARIVAAIRAGEL